MPSEHESDENLTPKPLSAMVFLDPLLRERLISISASPVNTEELTKKLRIELDQQNQTLQNNFQKLFTEHLELKSSFAKMDLEDTDLKRRIQRTEEKFSDIEKTIQDLKKAVES